MRRDLAPLALLSIVSCALQETPFVVDDPGESVAVTTDQSASGSKAVRIGALFAFESRSSLTENNTLSGIELAIRDANAAGGVAGQLLEIVKVSFDGTAPSAENAAKEAVKLGLSAVIGPSWSNAALKAAPILNDAKVPTIVTLASHPDVTKDRPFVFRAVGDDAAQARALASFAHDDLAANAWATFVDLGDTSSISSAARFSDAMLALGAHETRRFDYRSDANDAEVAASWAELQKTAPVTVVFLPTKVRDTARLMRLGRAQGFTGTFVGSDGWGNRELMIIAGQASRGAYFVTHWNPDLDAPGSVEFLDRYLARHRVEPTVGAAVGYDAARTLIAAMQAAGGPERSKVREALASGTFPCTTGTMQFDADRTAVRPMLVLKVGIARFDTHRLIAPPASVAGAATP